MDRIKYQDNNLSVLMNKIVSNIIFKYGTYLFRFSILFLSKVQEKKWHVF